MSIRDQISSEVGECNVDSVISCVSGLLLQSDSASPEAFVSENSSKIQSKFPNVSFNTLLQITTDLLKGTL